jgi:hypothetical protein
MMNTTQAQRPLFGPFAMLLDPERVVREMTDCDRLNRFQGRIYRPLDKPLIAKTGKAMADAAAFDRMVDDAADEAELNA